jgi:hypothetical protein
MPFNVVFLVASITVAILAAAVVEGWTNGRGASIDDD